MRLPLTPVKPHNSWRCSTWIFLVFEHFQEYMRLSLTPVKLHNSCLFLAWIFPDFWAVSALFSPPTPDFPSLLSALPTLAVFCCAGSRVPARAASRTSTGTAPSGSPWSRTAVSSRGWWRSPRSRSSSGPGRSQPSKSTNWRSSGRYLRFLGVILPFLRGFFERGQGF